VDTGDPYLSIRNALPPRWDGPYGTVVLVNKPKGELIAYFCYLVSWL
jgi:tRNA pseudouridine55 synthase